MYTTPAQPGSSNTGNTNATTTTITTNAATTAATNDQHLNQNQKHQQQTVVVAAAPAPAPEDQHNTSFTSDSESGFVIDPHVQELYRPLSSLALSLDPDSHNNDHHPTPHTSEVTTNTTATATTTTTPPRNTTRLSSTPLLNTADIPAELATPLREGNTNNNNNNNINININPASTSASASASTPHDSMQMMPTMRSSDPDRDSPVLNETLSFINAHITKLNAKGHSDDDDAAATHTRVDGAPLSPIKSTGYSEGDMMMRHDEMKRGGGGGGDMNKSYDNGDGEYTTMMMPEPETESEDEGMAVPPGIALQGQQSRGSSIRHGSSKRYLNDSASEYSANLSSTNLARPSSSQQYANPNIQNNNYHQQQQQQQQTSYFQYGQQQPPPPSTSASNSTTQSSTFLHPSTVKNWSPAEVSAYLLSIGVDPQHCAVFEEQEITGDVLLEMEQSTMFMKEFNFGTMGRRLKTWYRIKALQEEVLGNGGGGGGSAEIEGLRATSRGGQRSRAGSRSASRMGAGSAQGMHYNNFGNNGMGMGAGMGTGIGAAIADMRNSVASSIRQSLIPPQQGQQMGYLQEAETGFLPRIPSASGDRPQSPNQMGGYNGGGSASAQGYNGQQPAQNPAAFGYGYGHSYSTSTGSSTYGQPAISQQSQQQQQQQHGQRQTSQASSSSGGYTIPRYNGIEETASFESYSHPQTNLIVNPASAHAPPLHHPISMSVPSSRPGTNLSNYSAHARLPPGSSDSADAAPPPIVGGGSSMGMNMGYNDFTHPLSISQSQSEVQQQHPSQPQGQGQAQGEAMSIMGTLSPSSQVDVERGYFSEREPRQHHSSLHGSSLHGKHGGKSKAKTGNGFKKNMWGTSGPMMSRSRSGSVGGAGNVGLPLAKATTVASESAASSTQRRFSNLSGLGSTGAASESNKSPTNVNGFVGLYGDQITEEPPAVTNLEEQRPGSGATAGHHHHHHYHSSRQSSEKKRLSQSPTLRKAFGQRTASETDKARHMSIGGSPTAASFDSNERPTSAENRASVDGHGNGHHGNGHTNGGLHLSSSSAPKTPTKTTTMRSKSKKDTSAYTKGLEKKTPQEQLASGCDFYGWMKKRSSNLMTTWRPRFFILHGRRLSYYYSEDDTEERGVIDISGHRVIADNDLLVSLHASLTGSKAVPATSAHPIMDGEVPSTSSKGKRSVSGNSDKKGKNKKHGATSEGASTASQGVTTNTSTTSSPAGKEKDTKDKSHHDKGPRPFIFKLVPPKPGAARSVQFTKPSVHYFQVDNISQGRLWMAAMLKATIERDANLPVRTTNKQKTISLRQAAASHQRPPALMGVDERGMMGIAAGPAPAKPVTAEGALPMLGIGNGMGLGVFEEDDGVLAEAEDEDGDGGILGDKDEDEKVNVKAK